MIVLLMACLTAQAWGQERKRARAWGVRIGVLPTGEHNAITDVPGVQVGHVTLTEGLQVHTGVTAVLPHGGNIFQQKVPAAVYVGNGFGKLVGSTQVQELGTLETPIILTNTLSVGTAINAVVDYTLQQPGNGEVQSVNAVVGETNDGYLNDIRGRHVQQAQVQQTIRQAQTGPVPEGNVGAGTGTVCFGFKGGIGTASRKLPASMGNYTVGILVQTNFGGVLQIAGAPVGQALNQFSFKDKLQDSADGSCMIVIATDAPVDSRNLERMAKRAMMGLAKTGGIASNGSGDYVIAFSANPAMRIPHTSESRTQTMPVLRNEEMSPLFMAVIEATEEAILNSLFMAETTHGHQQHVVEALPIKKVLQILDKHHARKR